MSFALHVGFDLKHSILGVYGIRWDTSERNEIKLCADGAREQGNIRDVKAEHFI